MGTEHSLLAEVSHDEAKMRERRETSAGFRRVSYHACAGVSLTTSDVFLTCDTTHRTGLRAKLQLKAGVYSKCNLRGDFFYEIVRVTSSAKAFFEVVDVLIEGFS